MTIEKVLLDYEKWWDTHASIPLNSVMNSGLQSVDIDRYERLIGFSVHPDIKALLSWFNGLNILSPIVADARFSVPIVHVPVYFLMSISDMMDEIGPMRMPYVPPKHIPFMRSFEFGEEFLSIDCDASSCSYGSVISIGETDSLHPNVDRLVCSSVSKLFQAAMFAHNRGLVKFMNGCQMRTNPGYWDYIEQVTESSYWSMIASLDINYSSPSRSS